MTVLQLILCFPSSAAFSILPFATYIPDTKPIVRIRKSATTRYFFQSPESSRKILLIRGFLFLFFLILPHPLPFQILCGNLICINIIMSYHTVTQFDHMVCHVFDRFVMRYHNDRIAIFLIDILDQLQYFF